MKIGLKTAGLTVLAVAGVMACGSAFAQQPAGSRLYAFHTGRMGNCPGLDWHIVLEPDNKLNGFVAWDNMRHMAQLSGALNQNRSFQMDAKEVGGQQRTATVKGNAMGDYINAVIEGSGTACDGKSLNIPRVTGGLGGGGG